MAEQQQKQRQVPLTETPEFKAAVAEAATKAAARAVADAMKEVTRHGAPMLGADPDAKALFDKMALSIAEISDQGSGRKRIDPAELVKRQQAYDRLIAMVKHARDQAMEARRNNDVETERKWNPEYRVVSKIYFNERFIEPFTRKPDKTIAPTEIIWTGIPNEALRPINDVAKKIYSEFRVWIGHQERLKGTDNRAVWITPGGLVVKGDPPARATVAPTVPFDDDLQLKQGDDPNATQIHVLGTVAAPARTNQADNPQPRY